MGGYICIASSRGVNIKVPCNCWFSFFNSPYPAHKLCSAIDIYFPDEEGLFPADEGVVLEVQRFECPVYRSDADGFDYLTIIRVVDDVVLKILHVKPYVSPGDSLELGDCIGSLIVSGYFYPWSHMHMHVEIRSIYDPYRALGAFKLDISPTVRLLSRDFIDDGFYIVDEFSGEFAWLKPCRHDSFMSCGLTCRVDDHTFYIDGGVPHYGYGAVLGFDGDIGVKLHDSFGGVIGEVKSFGGSFSLFSSSSQPFVDGFPVYGIGSFINNSRVKIVRPDGWPYDVGDIVRLSFAMD